MIHTPSRRVSAQAVALRQRNEARAQNARKIGETSSSIHWRLGAKSTKPAIYHNSHIEAYLAHKASNMPTMTMCVAGKAPKMMTAGHYARWR